MSPLYRLDVVSRENRGRTAANWAVEGLAVLFLLTMITIFLIHR